MHGFPTGTVTFFFTDIEGSTRLLQRLGDRYATILAAYRRIMRAAVQESGGQEVDTQGEGFFFAFPRSRDAVAAAVAAQRAIASHQWPEGGTVQVRMGLHTGEPFSAETGYVGIDVHRAARICAAGHGGQILLSVTTRDLVEDDLPEGMSLSELGNYRLKDLARPQRIFQVVAPDLPANFPPLRSLDFLPNNLPVQLTSFIGREREVAEVKRLQLTTRLLTLTGAGGAGKTRLALQVAAEVLEDFKDGVWLVSLAALADPALVPQAVASALGVPEQPVHPLSETLAGYLRSKSLLLLLDNCEHLLSTCAHLAEALLTGCPNLRILATSREVLGIPGELNLRVPSLSLPDPKRLPSFETLTQYEAVRLFVDRATFVLPGFSVTASNAAAVAQVCARLDGIPLAIELAAARVKVLTVDQIAARMDDRFRFLTRGARTARGRHQTLRATIDWSYDLLSDEERVLLRRLSVFAGGWTLEAAEAICSGDDLEVSEILDLQTQLVDKSLIVVDTQGNQARYRVLETIRQYAGERLLESKDQSDIARRHGDWYMTLAEQADLQLRGSRQGVWLARLEGEHDNLRAALEWSKVEADGQAQLRLAGALHWFWFMHGHWSEGREALDGALARSNTPLSLLPKVFEGAAHFAWRQRDYQQARSLCEKGLAVCRELGAEKSFSVAYLLIVSGHLAVDSDPARASTLYQESLDLCRARGHKWLAIMAVTSLGRAATVQGDNQRAVAFLTEGLTLAKDMEDKWFIAYTLRSLGVVALDQHDHVRAGAFFRESLTLSSQISVGPAWGRGAVGERWVTEESLEGLAAVASAKGHYAQAARLFGAAEVLGEVLGLHHMRASDRAHYDESVAFARAALGDGDFGAAWAEGRALTLEQAIEYALKEAH